VVEELAGEVVLDVEKGVPLSVKLVGAVGFARDGRRFRMRVSITAAIGPIGATPISAPPDGEVVATPERLREVDDRDYLLQGIAPPIRKNSDGTAVSPTPAPAPSPPKATPPAKGAP